MSLLGGEPLWICRWTLHRLKLHSVATFLSQTIYLPSFCLAWWVQKLSEVAKSVKKTPYVHSKSFKVIKFVTSRKGICDVLLVVNSTVGRISHGFGATVTSQLWTHSCVIYTRGDLLHICWWTLYCQKLEASCYLSVKTASSCVHSFWHSTGMWWTDKQTEML